MGKDDKPNPSPRPTPPPQEIDPGKLTRGAGGGVKTGR